MKNCPHGKQNSLSHGKAVWKNVKKLILGEFEGFRLPQWFVDNHHFIINNLEDWKTIKLYTKLHDAGKNYCKVTDEEGKLHFPNHAAVSEKIFLDYFPQHLKVAELIGLDMIMHAEKYAEIEARNLPIKTLMTLLITAIAEIHANAEIFGGISSDSFKIKSKRLDKLGKKLIENLPKHIEEHSYIFVRRDIENSHKVVQASHAIFEQAKGQIEHPSFVVLGVKNEESLKKTMKHLLKHSIQFKLFREPMEPYNNSLTAIATEPLVGERRNLLRKYQLLKI